MSDEEGEGKEGEGRGAEGDLLAKAIKHCWSDNFLDVFRAYFRKHADVFEVCVCVCVTVTVCVRAYKRGTV